MTQSKLESWIEQILSVGSGLLLSTLIVQPLIFPLYGIHTTFSENFQMAVLFTIASIIRGYIWRRYFNRRLHIKLTKALHDGS